MVLLKAGAERINTSASCSKELNVVHVFSNDAESDIDDDECSLPLFISKTPAHSIQYIGDFD